MYRSNKLQCGTTAGQHVAERVCELNKITRNWRTLKLVLAGAQRAVDPVPVAVGIVGHARTGVQVEDGRRRAGSASSPIHTGKTIRTRLACCIAQVRDGRLSIVQ